MKQKMQVTFSAAAVRELNRVLPTMYAHASEAIDRFEAAPPRIQRRVEHMRTDQALPVLRMLHPTSSTRPTVHAPRSRERRPGRRRAGASSTTSSQDPGGDPDPELPPHVAARVQTILDRAARRILTDRGAA